MCKIMDDIAVNERKEGRKEGRMEGMAQGLRQGQAQGRAQGRAEGLAEGLAEGQTQGRKEGRAEATKQFEAATRETVRKMLAIGKLSVEEIAESFGLPVEEVKVLAKEQGA